MVHALQEIRRVLVPSGAMVDFRPVGASWPLEIVADGQRRFVARVDRAPHIRDDAACEQALAHALGEGWFVPERRETFVSPAYWDTFEELSAPVTISDAVRAEAEILMELAGPNAKICIRFENVLAGYRKRS